jgi:guanosine-3',5'-bis(diphosphate) 3'-pyrophosphohydrolase
LLHDVIEDVENGEAKLVEKWYSEKIIQKIKELSEDKSLSRKERKSAYIKHLENASSDIKTISAADKIYNVRSSIDQYMREQENLRTKFNAWKEDQIAYLQEYLSALKKNFNSPIVKELEDIIERFLEMVK